MTRMLAALVAGLVLGGAAAPLPPQERAGDLRRGILLYARPGLPDPNFAGTVVLLLEHGDTGSLGVVLNRPTPRGLRDVLDLQPRAGDSDLPVFWGGPVQPEAVLSLIRTRRPGPRARTVLGEVHVTPDLAEIQAMLDERDGRLRVRVFSGYAGWGRGQLAAEVRAGAWVLEPGDAATVFSPEPSRLWEKVHEILRRVRA